MTTYQYSIFDADPNSSSGTQWPGHDHAEITADGLSAAVDRVEEIMSAARYYDADGYHIGQRIYAIVWEDGTIVAEPKYMLTAEDIS